MTALELMRARTASLALVIFDCDGVIVDSEPISNGVIAADLTARGWSLSAEETERRFIGTTLVDMQPLIEEQLGHALPDTWRADITHRITAAMKQEAVAVAGAVEALHAVSRLGLPWRIASNSSREEMAAKFSAIGIADLTAGRIHSFDDVLRGKPAPDVFLAAAAAQGVPPERCVVIEDSVPGATAAAAAGMTCLGIVRHGDGAALRAVGAATFPAMADLPELLAAARR